MAAKRKYDSIIRVLHEQWCRDNGYPTGRKPFFTSGKLQATSAPHPNDLLDAENAKRFVDGAKHKRSAMQPEVASVRLQATSVKHQA